MKPVLAWSALALNIIGYIPYIRDIVRGKVKPHRYTWGIWTILTAIAAVNQIKNDGGWSSLFIVSAAVLVTAVFLLSLKYGMGGAPVIDKICLALAICLMIYWLSSQETRLSTLLVVIIDCIGAIPTVIKTYKHPETETYIQWTLSSIAGFLTILAVPSWDWALLIYPAYVFLMDGLIVCVKAFSQRQLAKA